MPDPQDAYPAFRVRAVFAAMAFGFLAVAGQLTRLALGGPPETLAGAARPLSSNFARPDIVDRGGRLLATDIPAPSLYADPSAILDRDEIVEKLEAIFPDLDAAALRRGLADRKRRFVWIKRGLSPAVAQRVHDLGLPGLAFRDEARRAYPSGRTAGHIIGAVDIDNKGAAGLERHIDATGQADIVQGAGPSARAPVRLSIDLGAQHALEDALRDAVSRHGAGGAAGMILDVHTGEVLASASTPETDPARPMERLDPARLDKISGAAYELGSIWKTFTVAMALEDGATPDGTLIDVRAPIAMGRFTIRDVHPSDRPLSVAEVFLRSSNIGAGTLGRAAGASRQRAFLARLGLLDPISTETGATPAPLTPAHWGELETVTIAYGHGVAAAPLQVAAAAAALVNGGTLVAPTFLRRAPGTVREGTRAISAATSARMRDLMRRNVADREGTGWRAEADGYRVGGKTGTAEIARGGRYEEKAVISSFLGAFPMDAPQYVALVMLFEPKGSAETNGEITAGLNAAPLAGRVIARVAPLLGVAPQGLAER